MAEIKDEILVSKFLSGDNRAFEKLLNRHMKPVYNFLFRLTRNSPSAEDLAQETFFKAWKNLRRFDQDKNFRVWLFSIARYTAYDYLRKKKAVPFAFFEDDEGNSWIKNVPDDKDLPSEIVLKIDSAKQLGKKLKKIPGNYQIILLMRYKDDFSLQEIAKILRKPYNTIKSQHRRGLWSLRKVIEEKNNIPRKKLAGSRSQS